MTDKERIKEIMSTDNDLSGHVKELLEISLHIQEINITNNFTLQERVQKLNYQRKKFWWLFYLVFDREIKPLGITNEMFLFHLLNHSWRFCIPFPRIPRDQYFY
jgi:hypothetical protein